MRFLIASDLHGAMDSLDFLIEKAKSLKPDQTVLLGDFLYHGPRNCLPDDYAPKGLPDKFAELMDLAPLTAVRGNCDAEVDLFVLPFHVSENAWLMDKELRMFVSHGHHIPEEPPMPGFPKGTVFLRGHIHKPRAETLDGWHFWNPGSITLPKNGWPRSWALYEDGAFTVCSMGGEVILSQALR